MTSEDGDLNDRQLTNFYLVMALGGAAGGCFTAVIAPLIFPFHLEYHLGLLASAFVPARFLRSQISSIPPGMRRSGVRFTVMCGILLLTSLLAFDAFKTLRYCYSISRSFFGVIRVEELLVEGNPMPYAFKEFHGTTLHGFQFVNPHRAQVPTTYYSPDSGIGIVMRSHRLEQTRRVGVVGLGVGTLAAYGRPGDIIDFYEIDPIVRGLAQDFFRYLGDCQATINVVPGDARLTLEKREVGLPYDVLVLDAFSSDAIPAHLLTAEAFEVYRQHLADDAIMAVNISSRNFDLRSVLAGHAQRLNWSAVCVYDVGMDPTAVSFPSIWVLMSPHESSLGIPKLAELKMVPMDETLDWTDDKHSLFQILGRLPL